MKFKSMILDNLQTSGRAEYGAEGAVEVRPLEPYAGVWVNAAKVEYTDEDGKHSAVAVSVGPEHGTVGPEHGAGSHEGGAPSGVGFDLLIVVRVCI